MYDKLKFNDALYYPSYAYYKMCTTQNYQAYKIYVASLIITKYMGLEKNRFYGAINQL